MLLQLRKKIVLRVWGDERIASCNTTNGWIEYRFREGIRLSPFPPSLLFWRWTGGEKENERKFNEWGSDRKKNQKKNMNQELRREKKRRSELNECFLVKLNERGLIRVVAADLTVCLPSPSLTLLSCLFWAYFSSLKSPPALTKN